MVQLCLELTTLLSPLVQERTWYQVLFPVCVHFGELSNAFLDGCSCGRCLKCRLYTEGATSIPKYCYWLYTFLIKNYQVCLQLAHASVELSTMLLATSRMLMTGACHLMSLWKAWRRRVFGFLELATGTVIAHMAHSSIYIPPCSHSKALSTSWCCMCRIKSRDNRDKRVELLQKYARTQFPNVKYMEYAVTVETYTLTKANNLVLNVDGCIGSLFLDLLSSCAMFTPQEINEIIEIGYLNGLFVLARSIGLIGYVARPELPFPVIAYVQVFGTSISDVESGCSSADTHSTRSVWSSLCTATRGRTFSTRSTHRHITIIACHRDSQPATIFLSGHIGSPCSSSGAHRMEHLTGVHIAMQVYSFRASIGQL